MPRNDYRDRAPQKFGKKTVSYPQGDLAFPTVSREGNKRKNADGSEIEFLTPNEEYPGALLTSQHSDKGDDDGEDYRQTYETLPGPWFTITQHDADGAVLTIRRRHNIRADILTLESVSGEGASLVAHISGGAVNSVTVHEGGSGYYGNPVVTFSTSEGGKTAQGYALTSADGTIASVVLSDGGSGYTDAPDATVESNLWTKTTIEPLGESAIVRRTIPANISTRGGLPMSSIPPICSSPGFIRLGWTRRRRYRLKTV